ncbi:hypothetical protein DRQ26_00670 [bacterium]|nr:MAG: hypothetical protein DRQ26_00670 [bacterium]
MALSETLVYIFLMLIGFGFLYFSFKRKQAIAYPFLATVIFSATILYGGSIPFQVDNNGAVIGTSANVVLTGVSLLFTFIALIFALKKGFELFGLKPTREDF